MRLSKRELIMLVFLIIIAVIFIEYRFMIVPAIEDYDKLLIERQSAQSKIQEIDLNMAIAKQNEMKRDDSIQEIKKLAGRFFSELQMDALLVRTHDLILEQGLNPLQYQIQQIQASPLMPAEFNEMEMTYEMKNLAQTYWLITGASDPAEISNNPVSTASGDQIEQYQISFSARGTYTQLNDYLEAVSKLQRSIVVSSLTIIPDTTVIPTPTPAVTEPEEPGVTPAPTPTPIVEPTPEEADTQLLSMQITLYYYGLVKLIPTEDTFNQWYREPFTPVEYSPFKDLPVPVETLPTDPDAVPAETTTGN